MQSVFRQIKSQVEFKRQRAITYPAHIHEDIELIYVKKGGCTAVCDGRKYTLADNTFFLAFPNQVHHYSDCVQGEYYVLILKPSRLLSYGEMFLEGAPVSAVYRPEEADNTVYLLETAYTELLRDGYSRVIGAYLTAIFGKLLRHYPIERTGIRQDTVLQILQYCAGHCRESITVGDIAEHLKISRSSISHIFSSRLGIHFCDYINALRLADAVELLTNGNYSVTEIAGIAGFSTIRTFNRAFLRQYGMSPTEYRKVYGVAPDSKTGPVDTMKLHQ